jgi:hypothetical protein
MNAIIHHCLRGCALLLACVTPSCLILPTPPLHSGDARENVDASAAAGFQVGKTTRAEVILTLGEPDTVTADERKLAYRTEKVRALLFIGGYGAAAGAPITKDDYLVFEFDARGRLVSSSTSGHWGWHADPGRTLGESAPPAPAQPCAWSGDASWLVGVDDYRALGFTGNLEWLRGRLTLTGEGLEFRSKKEFANAPPALTLPYREITSVAEDRMLLVVRLLAVHTRGGKTLAFQVFGTPSWRSDPQRLREARDLIQTRLPRR